MAQSTTAAPRRATLRAANSPATNLIITSVFAIVWNAIVVGFLVKQIEGLHRGPEEWLALLFMTPFVLIGLGAIAWVCYQVLALFNPRPFVSVSSPIALGEGLEVEWETAGKVDRVRSFRITIEGREEATYTRGTTTSTDKETFAVLEVARGLEAMRGSGAQGLRRGNGKIVFPAHAMHSFESANNKIVWMLRVHGEILLWPDVNEEYELTVEPARMGNRA